KTGTAFDSGFYASADQGENWLQQVELLNTGEGRAFFKTAQANFLKVDPQDPKALYLGTINDGLYYTFNKALGWQRTLSKKGVIYDLAVDPKDKCTLYVAVGNKIYKSIDCARSWEGVYLEGLPEQVIKTVAVDDYNNNKIYFGTSGGGIFKSVDYGNSWEAIKWLDSSVQRIIINPKDTRKIYAATLESGIYKSDNEGVSWKNITDVIKGDNPELGGIAVEKRRKYDNVDYYMDMELDLSQDDALIYANKYGIFHSETGGYSWRQLKLLTKPDTINIYAVAINPNDSKEIYYSTATAFVKSFDGGENWISKPLPTTKTPIDLLVDLDNKNNVFIVVKSLKK
ncbi:hypothetical protein K8R66_00040, partial [bacterium]|nr:hypothetical protein [bacterium]